MRRVLIVTSSYAPTMIADMHRARQLAWELPKLGWEVEILCPDVSFQDRSYVDEDSSDFFSRTVKTHFVTERFPLVFRVLGSRNIGFRAFVPLLLSGRKLFSARQFDLVFISTAKFPLFLLGSAWKKWFGIPFVLDLHDPCYKGNVTHPLWPPKMLKRAIGAWLSKFIEINTVPAAAGLISVSPRYIDTMRNRYEGKSPDWLRGGNNAVVPFAALQLDLDQVCKASQRKKPDARHPARIVYIGVGGSVMLRSFSLLCRALSHLRAVSPELVDGVRIELYGTMQGWGQGDPRHLAKEAKVWELDDLVSEHPDRVTYRQSLELLLNSDGALILGVDDDGYMPSKLFSYALSRRPLLASLHRDGPAFAEFQSTPDLGRALWFGSSEDMADGEAAEVVREFLEQVKAKESICREGVVQRYLASEMAQRHAVLFDTCLASDQDGVET